MSQSLTNLPERSVQTASDGNGRLVLDSVVADDEFLHMGAERYDGIHGVGPHPPKSEFDKSWVLLQQEDPILWKHAVEDPLVCYIHLLQTGGGSC